MVTLGAQETKGEDNMREGKSNKKEFQDIIHCNELPFNLTLLKKIINNKNLLFHDLE